MSLTKYTPNGRNKWDILRWENARWSKKGRIERRRGKFVAIITRDISLMLLDGACAFVADLNAQC